MTSPISPPPVLLVAGTGEQTVLQTLEGLGHVVVRMPTAAMSLDFARAMKPDAILVDSRSLDVSGIDFCAQLSHDVEVDADTPILLMLSTRPTRKARVAGVRAGVRDYLYSSDSAEEIALKIGMHVRAGRNVHGAAGGGVLNRHNGVLTWAGVARRVRELGALLVRMHGGLSCVVFVFTNGPQDGTEATLIAGAARASDVVGEMSHSEAAILIPGTGQQGARQFANRMGVVLRQSIEAHPVLANVRLKAGYACVDNLAYAPLSPMELLSDAARAVTAGIIDVEHPWIRRFAWPEDGSPMRVQTGRASIPRMRPAPPQRPTR